MIVDTSALVAILWGEAEAQTFIRLLATNPCAMSVASHVETSIVVDARRDPLLSRRLDEVVAVSPIELVPVTALHGRIARDAYRDFGKGSGHPAQLNFGDCFTYALARDRDEPLLCKGEDFARTDIRLAS